MSQLATSYDQQSPALNSQFSSTTDLVLDYQAMEQMNRLAEMMANGRATVPNHLQGNPADCMAVIMQAAQWRMNPFAVAQKTHVVSGTLGYEAQLVNAVVCSSTKVRDSFHYEWFGNWERVIGNFITKTSQKGSQYQAPNWTAADEKGLGVRVWATLKGESEPRLLELLLSQAQVRNSTLWASDPKQQLAYLAVKRWARLYAPDVILGVYSSDELYEQQPEKELNPSPAPSQPREPELEDYPQERFNELLPKWRQLIVSGQRTAQEVIDMLSAKSNLSNGQVDTILSIELEQEEQQDAASEQE
ncbi:RecT family recombinase [Idiomarina xiamenensis]|uniref:RecT protein n=1 Tax=Idiomarina xiamenensis 10-D-4 TaxID=740709 RepID=K2J8H9_9GAMM|nr:RecT family recombinase [Idiomarina xiamenensis]EKE79446.1 RecT protein [Idiomarina xiamenensis 10-D-4]